MINRFDTIRKLEDDDRPLIAFYDSYQWHAPNGEILFLGPRPSPSRTHFPPGAPSEAMSYKQNVENTEG